MSESHNKPECQLIGQDGNIFNLLSVATRTLRNNGLHDQAEELSNRIWSGEAESYYHAINIIMEYVEIV